MKTYIIILRGINVSGKNKILMQDLRAILNDLGYKNTQTYIQSGNIILESGETKTIVCEKIREVIATKFGYDVPVLIRTIEEWRETVKKYPFSLENEKIVAFTFLNKTSEETEFEVKGIKEDVYKIVEDVVYLNCPSGFGKTKLTNSFIEKKLNVVATTRNYKTTVKLLELAEGFTNF